MKIVINRCWDGFSISKKAAEYMAKHGSKQAKAELAKCEKDTKHDWYGYGYCSDAGFDDGYKRDDPLLVKAVEKLGNGANGDLAKLVVVEIPDGVKWDIDDYDGMETVAEAHRTWA